MEEPVNVLLVMGGDLKRMGTAIADALKSVCDEIRKLIHSIRDYLEAQRIASKPKATPPCCIGAVCAGHRRRVRPCARSCC